MKRKKIFKRSEHKNRDDLAGEAGFGDLGQIICLFVFLLIWIPDSFIFHFSTFASQYIPLFLRLPPAIILFVLASYLASTGLRTVFGEVRETPKVIDKGVFKIIRHPIYLASLMTYTGMILISLSLFSFICWIGIIIFHNYLATYEERKLVQKYGKEYLSYKKRVGKWFPKFYN